jgi:hypothetical protein
MSHGRRYGEKDSHPIPLWNGVFEHYDRIGNALWEFAWCIDAVTVENDGTGLVLGGSPVKLGVIVKAIKGRGEETIRRHLKKLVDGKYIRIRRTPYGQVIEVLNSKKFGIWKKQKPQNDVSLPERNTSMSQRNIKMMPEKHQNDASKEDSAVTQHKDAAVKHTACDSELWNLLGVLPQNMPPEFRGLCEQLYVTNNGQPLSEFVGVCMDAWEAQRGGRHPRVFVQAANRIRNCERRKEYSANTIPELEALPWAKKS